MDDAFGGNRIQRLRNLTTDFQGFLDRQRPFGNTLSQRLAWHQPHGQKMHTIGLFKSVDGCSD